MYRFRSVPILFSILKVKEDKRLILSNRMETLRKRYSVNGAIIGKKQKHNMVSIGQLLLSIYNILPPAREQPFVIPYSLKAGRKEPVHLFKIIYSKQLIESQKVVKTKVKTFRTMQGNPSAYWIPDLDSAF